VRRQSLGYIHISYRYFAGTRHFNVVRVVTLSYSSMDIQKAVRIRVLFIHGKLIYLDLLIDEHTLI